MDPKIDLFTVVDLVRLLGDKVTVHSMTVLPVKWGVLSGLWTVMIANLLELDPTLVNKICSGLSVMSFQFSLITPPPGGFIFHIACCPQRSRISHLWVHVVGAKKSAH